jgi:4-amino-4-deoxy-L-arabinose transferase-like glycosyltransferase
MLNDEREIDKREQAPARSEWVLVLILCLAGLGLRAAHPSRLGVEHFDEGVYASNIFFSGEPRDEHYPSQHLYAPPLVPVLIEWTMVFLGGAKIAPFLVGIIAGTLTIPLVWWVGRRWFSPTAGLAAATFVTCNEMHILFSRTALTDIVLCLFLLAAVHFFWVAQTTSSRLALFASGGFTGLAWWTKYNGWLPLAIGIAGAVPWKLVAAWLAPPPSDGNSGTIGRLLRPLVKPLLIWLAVAIIALLVWSPFWWSLQGRGGYAAVAANHQKYILGFAKWSTTFGLQARKLSLLCGPLTGCSALFAMILALLHMKLASSRFTWNVLLRNDVVYLSFPVLALLSVIEGAAVILGFLGAIGTLIALARSISADDRSDPKAKGVGLAGWMLTAWFAGLLLSVFLYKDYPRLMLPLLLVSWLGLGVLADALLREIQNRLTRPQSATIEEPLLARRRGGAPSLSRAKPILLLVLGLGIAYSLVERRPWEQGIVAWQSRAGLADLTPEILDDIVHNAGVDLQTEPDKFVVYTYGEPALLFQLRRLGCTFVKPVKELSFAYPEAPAPKLTSYVAFGYQAWSTEGFGEQLAPALPRLQLGDKYRDSPSQSEEQPPEGRLQLVGKYRYSPSDVVQLDYSLIERQRRREFTIEVYRIK